jgi:hypothetical protein
MSKSFKEILQENEASLKDAQKQAKEELEKRKQEKQTRAIVAANEILEKNLIHNLATYKLYRKKLRELKKDIQICSDLTNLDQIKKRNPNLHCRLVNELQKGGISVES